LDWHACVHVLREHFEGKFPLCCASCGREFRSLRDYLQTTTHLGAPVSHVLDSGAVAAQLPEVGETTSFARCPCGTTLALDLSGMPLVTRLALLSFARGEAKRRAISFRQLLRDLRDDIGRLVLAGEQAAARGADGDNAPPPPLDDSRATVARYLRFSLSLGLGIASVVVVIPWVRGGPIVGPLAVWALVLGAAVSHRLLGDRPRVAAGVVVAFLAGIFFASTLTFGPLAGAGLILATANLLVAVEFGRSASIATSAAGVLLMLLAYAVSQRVGYVGVTLPPIVWIRTAFTAGGLSLFIGLTTSSLVRGLRETVTKLDLARQHNERMIVDLARRRELETVGRLVGGVVHDVNNSLTVLSSCVEVLLEEPMTEGTREVVADLADAVQTTHGTMSGLLEFVRTDKADGGTCDPAEAVGRVLRNLRRLLPKDIELEASLVEGHRVSVARGALVQAVLNLVLNARDACEGVAAKKAIDVRVEPSEAAMIVSVRDNGRGMAGETVRRAGEPLFTTKGGFGTGLGLSMVRATVEAAGGRMLIQSEVGRGTEVRLVLPRVAAVSPIASPEARPSLDGVRVLLVEDDDTIRRGFARALSAAGASVVERASVRDAVELLSGDHSPADMLVCDGILGDGTAADVVARFSAVYPGTPVLVVSGHQLDELTDRGLVLTKDVRFVAKPLSGGELARIATRALAKGDALPFGPTSPARSRA
jgi:signal transduction histidine kinase